MGDDKPSASEGWLGITLRIIFLVIGVIAVVCSVLLLSNCNFFDYTSSIPPPGFDDNRPPEFVNINSAEVGLFRYNPDSLGCRELTDDFDSFSGYFTAARVGATLATIMGVVGLALLVLELACCRYPISRCLISSAFFVAFVAQALTFLVYAAPVCDPNFKNGPYPCSTAEGNWISTAACVLYFCSCCLACCLPKPIPIFLRMRQSKDEGDGCCAICAKKSAAEEEEIEEGEEEEETADEEADEEAKGAVVVDVAEIEAQQAMLNEQKAAVAAATALAAVRRGKHDEIEKQLGLLDKYKDRYTEEEYNEKVGILLAALPDPSTFDAYTKTEVLAPREEEEDEEQGTDIEKEEVKKKSMMQKMSSGMSKGMSKTKEKVMRSGKKKQAESAIEEAPPETPIGVAEEDSIEVDA